MKYTLVASDHRGNYSRKFKSHHHISVGDHVILPFSGNAYEVLEKSVEGDDCYLKVNPPGSESAHMDGWNEPR
jgi:hypothetical protein